MTTKMKFNILIPSILLLSINSVLGIHEDALLTVPQLIEKYEYPLEEHYVTTDDDYILAMHRIPDGKVPVPVGQKRSPPILLLHSLWSTSADFVIQGPTHSLGYLLADTGYDVWLGNTRGGTYSTNHTTLNPRAQFLTKFWDFSFHEKGVHDLPAMIDYVLAETGATQVIIIGVSEGSAAFFVMGAEKPAYLAKVQAHIAYAPAVYVHRTTFLLARFFVLLETFGYGQFVTNYVGHFDIAPDSLVMNLINWACNAHQITSLLCNHGISPVLDSEPGEIIPEMTDIILGHMPASTSTKQIIHFLQLVRAKNFMKYKPKFGTKAVPYDLSGITTPIYVFYSKSDKAVNWRDVEKLESVLPNGFVNKWRNDKFGHVDFVLSKNAKNIVFDETIALLNTITTLV